MNQSVKKEQLQFTKTGTTIAGCKFKGGVVLGSDTRATAGGIADKNCQKLYKLADNMYCAGAGTAADLQWQAKKLNSELQLIKLNTGRQSRVQQAITRLSNHLFNYQGHLGVHLIVGGVDCTGPVIAAVSASGYKTYEPYLAMGSGSLAAMTMLEKSFQDDMTEEQAKDLVAEAIYSGVSNDLMSGNNVNLVVIKENSKVEFFRPYKPEKYSVLREGKGYPFSFPIGNTPFISKTEVKIEKELISEEITNKLQKMEIE